MSDWEKLIWERLRDYKYFESIKTNKTIDLDNLEKSGLPCDDRISVPYRVFTRKNKELISFLEKYISEGDGFCVRAIPTSEGRNKGFTRKPTFGFLDFDGCKKFLEEVIGKNTDLFSVEITNWRPNKYGGVIIANEKEGFVIGEIANDLAALTGEEGPNEEGSPLASFRFDLQDPISKLKWYRAEDKKAQQGLYEVVRKYVLVGEWNDLKVNPGYYEFIFREGELKFVDFKLYPMFLK